MPKVFISYRRNDAESEAGRLYDNLVDAIGAENVFMDVDSISAGDDFRRAIEGSLEQSDAALILIGENWLEPSGKPGQNSRLDDPDDYVRLEIEIALEHKLKLIPVLLRNSVMPAEVSLPESIRDLALRNAVTLRSGSDYRPDIERLFKAIKVPEKRGSANLKRFVMAICAFAVIALAWFGWDRLNQTEIDPEMSQSGAADPEAVAAGTKILKNLDKTTNQGSGFDYWPDGGIRIAYYHLKTFYSYEDLVKLSPVPLFLSGPHGQDHLNLESDDSFGHYNPAFLSWVSVQLDALLSDTALINASTELFGQYLAETLLTYWDTHEILREHRSEFEALLADYQERIDTARLPPDYYYNTAWNGRDYLDSIKKLDDMHNINVIAPAVYFWLRREIDGTRPQVIRMLSELLASYGVIDSSKYSNVKDVIDFEDINMFEDVDSMKKIQERIKQSSGG